MTERPPPRSATPALVFEAFVADISAANAGGSEADARAVFARHSLELAVIERSAGDLMSFVDGKGSVIGRERARSTDGKNMGSEE